jgi:glucose-1-phosphate thymidylyltransferase
MKAIFLCAGYGTRLYPLTKDKPKALLSIAGTPLLNYLLEKVEAVSQVDQVVLVTNNQFYQPFCSWQKSLKSRLKTTVLNDQTTNNDNRLGAIKDLKFALNEAKLNDDVLVLASDNLFDSDLNSFVNFASQKKTEAAVGVYDVKDRQLATKYGLIKMDADNRVTGFFEKPKEPSTTLASMGIYWLSQKTFPLLDRYLAANQNPDAPGHYFSWLSKQIGLYAYPVQGNWFDIGDIESYERADQYFNSIGT